MTTAPPAIECLVDARCALAESPVWDDTNQRLLWADIPAGTIHAFQPTTGERQQWRFDRLVSSFGLARSGRLVVACGVDVLMFDMASGKREPLARIDVPFPLFRLNDGKVGPDGAFWVGTMHDVPAPERQPLAALYRVSADGQIERKVDGLKVSNGLAWSADGRTMFHSDSAGPWIDRWDFDPASGEIGGRTRIRTLTDAEGRPDGGACDAEGFYWSCGVSAGCLNRFSRDGELVARLPFPVPAPTMPAFGGEGRRTAFITSLRRPDEALLAQFPQSGGVFTADLGVAGVSLSLFND